MKTHDPRIRRLQRNLWLADSVADHIREIGEGPGLGDAAQRRAAEQREVVLGRIQPGVRQQCFNNSPKIFAERLNGFDLRLQVAPLLKRMMRKRNDDLAGFKSAENCLDVCSPFLGAQKQPPVGPDKSSRAAEPEPGP